MNDLSIDFPLILIVENQHIIFLKHLDRRPIPQGAILSRPNVAEYCTLKSATLKTNSNVEQVNMNESEMYKLKYLA